MTNVIIYRIVQAKNSHSRLKKSFQCYCRWNTKYSNCHVRHVMAKSEDFKSITSFSNYSENRYSVKCTNTGIDINAHRRHKCSPLSRPVRGARKKSQTFSKIIKNYQKPDWLTISFFSLSSTLDSLIKKNSWDVRKVRSHCCAKPDIGNLDNMKKMAKNRF